eukprot:1144867-Pelagomonas_calceolata.AAC.11
MPSFAFTPSQGKAGFKRFVSQPSLLGMATFLLPKKSVLQAASRPWTFTLALSPCQPASVLSGMPAKQHHCNKSA